MPAVLLAGFLACKFSTANISSLKLCKDKDITQVFNTFEPTDIIYGLATISNAPGKVKVIGHLAVEDVEGEKSGPVSELEATVDLPESGTVIFTFTPPEVGFPKGKYNLEVEMLSEGAEEKDTKIKSSPFTIQ